MVHVPDNVVLKAVVENSDENFDFCMCNPPFFSDAMEAQGLFSRSNNRPQSVSMSTASPQESIVPGGEIGFVKKLIVESTFLRCKVRLEILLLFLIGNFDINFGGLLLREQSFKSGNIPTIDNTCLH